ncbi:MAG: histidinol dehydrogenase [Bacillota bacterium]
MDKVWRIFSSITDRAAVATLLDRRGLLGEDRAEVREAVAAILARVRQEGDAALLEYTRRFDRVDLAAPRLRVAKEEILAGVGETPAELREAIKRAAENIRRFHEAQIRRDIMVANPDGSLLALRFLPLARVGVYAPGGAGGFTPLISSVLMNIIPAQVAGVKEIAVCSPPRPDGTLAPALLTALAHLGIEKVYRVGGAQAVAAMAYGTATIPSVEKIVGPGNRYVTEAKRQVFGRVGIDLLAGPSEVAVVADETANPRLVAADLLAQAEHDPEAGAVLLTPSPTLAAAVGAAVEDFLAALPRAEVARTSLARHGGAVVTRDLEEALDLAETLAPEHLELMVADPWAWAAKVRRAGAVFLGAYSPEALGDYVAGTNHVLPTNGTARFASGLGVDDFLRRMSMVAYSAAGFQQDAPAAVELAAAEGLTAHALSLQERLAGREGR